MNRLAGLLWIPLSLALMGSTCVVVEEGPDTYSYEGQESNEHAMEQEQIDEAITESER